MVHIESLRTVMSQIQASLCANEAAKPEVISIVQKMAERAKRNHERDSIFLMRLFPPVSDEEVISWIRGMEGGWEGARGDSEYKIIGLTAGRGECEPRLSKCRSVELKDPASIKMIQSLNEMIRSYHPTFWATSMAIRRWHKSSPHVHVNNIGDNVVRAFGTYSGGNTAVFDPESRVIASVDTRLTPLRFNAQHVHWSEECTQSSDAEKTSPLDPRCQRFVVVWFCLDISNGLDSRDREWADFLKFPLPDTTSAEWARLVAVSKSFHAGDRLVAAAHAKDRLVAAAHAAAQLSSHGLRTVNTAVSFLDSSSAGVAVDDGVLGDSLAPDGVTTEEARPAAISNAEEEVQEHLEEGDFEE